MRLTPRQTVCKLLLLVGLPLLVGCLEDHPFGPDDPERISVSGTLTNRSGQPQPTGCSRPLRFVVLVRWSLQLRCSA